MTERSRPSTDPNDLVPAPDATPLSRTVVRPPRRWHRVLTVPSGWTLLVCLFLPSLRLCETSQPIPMVVVPFCWPPYLVGMLIALAAIGPPAAIRARGLTLFILIRVSAAAFACMAIMELLGGAPVGAALIVLVLSAIAFAVTWREATERAVAEVSLLAALGAFVFTLAIASERLAVWGAFAGAFSACVLVIGTLLWCIETRVRSG